VAELARETTPEGAELVLYRRNGVYTLRVDGLELMSSRTHGSEEALARLACEGLGSAAAAAAEDGPRVLVGGLGFGYTLRAILDRLGDRGEVVVCEVFESLFEWNRTFLTDLAGRPLDDPRVEPLHADVWDVLDTGGPFDAILLDVDNGPWAFTLPTNERLYENEGLARLAAALTDTGRLAIWSSKPSPDFERRLQRTGLTVTTEVLPVRGGGRPHHTIFVAVRG